ncbi:hypothetical protein NDU88_006424 [Pleurodeles waltl]|uniref:Uncharacterized protein n=1 Tax=Pleurodeles waltl TaxID=8319 RepID=A0AAV7TYH8_PLEWA|nr:hypothetical protein NDU88_006424 [Pleurodeles waltl]
MWTRHGQRDTLLVLVRTTRYPSNRDAVSITSVTTRGVRRDVAQECRCAARVYSCTALEPALAVRSNGQRLEGTRRFIQGSTTGTYAQDRDLQYECRPGYLKL